MKALLVIDVQNDFCPGGNLAVNDGDKIVKGINDLMDNYDLVVYTQDWHPKTHKSFAVNWKDKNPFEVVDLNGIEQVLWPEHCVENTKGAEFHPDLDIKNDYIFKKGGNPEIDSYSGFFENDGKTPTGLEKFLDEKGVVEVDVVGLALDFCVRYTAEDADKIGYKTRILKDYTKSIGDFDEICKDIENNNIELV